MSHRIPDDLFDLRIKTLRGTNSIQEACRCLDRLGHPTAYEALRAFRNRNRGLVETPPTSSGQALRRIVERISQVPADAGPTAMGDALREVRAMAQRAIGGA